MNNPNDKKTMNDFSAEFADIKPLKQDRHRFSEPMKNQLKRIEKEKQAKAETFFSDTYQPILPIHGPMSWQRDDTDKQTLKRIRRGDYCPDLMLDLHGLRQADAKNEISALLHACIKQHVQCCSIMHGFGSGTLKQQVPRWLAQHPQVLAFHQAPKEWGGKAALLVLMDIGEFDIKRD